MGMLAQALGILMVLYVVYTGIVVIVNKNKKNALKDEPNQKEEKDDS